MVRNPRILSREPLLEAASFRSRTTGIPDIIVYVFEQTINPHSPKIKVMKNIRDIHYRRKYISVSISDNPRIISGNPDGIIDKNKLNLVFNWIKLNKEPLIDYWNLKMCTNELLDLIVPVK